MTTTRAKWGMRARIALSCALIAWFLAWAEPANVIGILKAIPLWCWCSAFLLHLFSQIVSAFRWRAVSLCMGIDGTAKTFLSVYFIGMFFNLFLPTSIGGDVVKAVMIGRGEGRVALSAASVLADRLLGILAMFLLGAAAICARPDLLGEPFRTLLLGTGSASLALVLFAPFLHSCVRSLLPTLAERTSRLLAVWRDPRRLVEAFCLSIVVQLTGMGILPILGKGIGIDVAPPVYYMIFPFIALATFLPFSINGIGIREGGFISLLALYHVPSDAALTLGLAFFGIHVMEGLLGGIVYATGFHKRPCTAPTTCP